MTYCCKTYLSGSKYAQRVYTYIRFDARITSPCRQGWGVENSIGWSGDAQISSTQGTVARDFRFSE